MSTAAPRPDHGYSAAQVRAAEAPLLAAGEPLMLRAASALAAEIERVLKGRADAAGSADATGAAGERADAASRPHVVVLAGSGDNGGDALFAGAELAARGADVRIVATGSRIHEAAAAAARAAGAIDLDADADPGGLDRAILDADVIVDGILGIGAAASPALRGRAREIVARALELSGGPPSAEPLAEQSAGPHAEPSAASQGGPRRAAHPASQAQATRHPLVVAVDLPSGISPDDGSVPDPTVLPADVTVTFGAVKAGLLLAPGSGYAGRVVLVDLGLGPALAGVEPAMHPDDSA